jgi:hypothetical protein
MTLKSLSFSNATVKTAGLAIASVAIGLTATAPAQAVSVFFNSTTAGANQFDTIVNNAGSSVVTDSLPSVSTGTSWNRGDYTITRLNGGNISSQGYGALNGQVLDIFPSSRNVQLSKSSGIQFTFNNPINALGFEVGDWGTCCLPSALYMSFDNGAPIQVGLSTTSGDVFYNGRAEAFTGAIDDTNTFTTVQFWGDGVGEALYAGGRVRYAGVAIGSVTNGTSTSVPEPFTVIGSLIGGTAAFRMKKKLKSAKKA